MKIEDFPKRERIVSQKIVDCLFSGKGSQSVVAFPVRAVYAVAERTDADAPAAQLLISVPKRRLKHAVDRNRVKRQLREAWRHQRQLLTDHVAADLTVSVALVWITDQHQSSDLVAARVANILSRIARKL